LSSEVKSPSNHHGAWLRAKGLALPRGIHRRKTRRSATMFCSECGKQVTGKFCCHCGTPLGKVANVDVIDAPVEVVWENEVRYDMLLKLPQVRETIDRHARLAKKGISGEQFLSLCEAIIPMGVPLEKLAGFIQPLYARLGIGTGKQRTETIAAPVGRVILRALCFLARNGHSMRHVSQAEDGCELEAVLPSDIWALEGDLILSIKRQAQQTQVTAATKIGGQVIDWGKSSRCLDRLFTDLRLDPAA